METPDCSSAEAILHFIMEGGDDRNSSVDEQQPVGVSSNDSDQGNYITGHSNECIACRPMFHAVQHRSYM